MADICMVLKGNIRYDGRVRKEISTLVSAGHHIELIVPDLNKTCSDGTELGINIHYVPLKIWSTASMNFLENLLFNRRAASIIKKLKPTHIHCHDLDSLLAGVWVKETVKAALIFDAHELYPESWGGTREKIWGYIEKLCIRSCNYIIMPEKNRITYFKGKYPHISKLFLLQNFPRRRDIPNGQLDLFRSIYPIGKEQKIILYTGSMEPSRRNIGELIDSMAMCGKEFVLMILGGTRSNSSKEAFHKRINHLGIEDRIFIHNAVPHKNILQYMASADVGTAFYRNSNINNYYCASNKIYEFIALEKPVLTNNYPGLLETVERFRQGVCLAEITPKNLTEAYIQAIDPGLIIPGAKKYFWEDEEHILLQLYDR